MDRMFKRTVFIWNGNLCNIIEVITVIFDKLDVSMLNSNINFFIKILLTPNFWHLSTRYQCLFDKLFCQILLWLEEWKSYI